MQYLPTYLRDEIHLPAVASMRIMITDDHAASHVLMEIPTMVDIIEMKHCIPIIEFPRSD